MYKAKVALDTQSDIREFVDIASSIPEDVFLEDGSKLRVNAKSLLGVMYGTSDFENLYVISDSEFLRTKFIKFVI